MGCISRLFGWPLAVFLFVLMALPAPTFAAPNKITWSQTAVDQTLETGKNTTLTVSFTVLKHQLDLVKAEFAAEEYYHIGDTDLDRMAAQRAGFEYLSSVEKAWYPA